MCSCETRPHRPSCPVIRGRYVAGGQVPDVDEAPAATSLAAGAITRSVDDAHAAYRARLARAVADMQEASVQD